MNFGRPEAHASLSHSGCVLRQNLILWKNVLICYFKEQQDAKLIFRLFATFLRPTILRLGANQKCLFTESMSVMAEGEKH